MTRACTWSQYKCQNTIKFFIGISPQGVISFVSKAWGGRVSDKYLTEHSDFLKNILPGDAVPADRVLTLLIVLDFTVGNLKFLFSLRVNPNCLV